MLISLFSVDLTVPRVQGSLLDAYSTLVTHYAWWKTHIFCAICAKLWWIVDVGSSHTFDICNSTKEQEKYLDLDTQLWCFKWISVLQVCDLKNSHNLWIQFQLTCEGSNIACDDHIDESVIVDNCSTSRSNDVKNFSISTSLDNDDNFSCHIDKVKVCASKENIYRS